METKKNEAQGAPAEKKRKKRVRPSLGQMRELTRRLAEAEEAVHSLVGDCDAWRDKYRALNDARTKAVKVIADVEAELKAARDKIAEMSEENVRLMNAATNAQKEKERLQKQLLECNEAAMQARAEAKRLRSRSWWRRLLNR